MTLISTLKVLSNDVLLTEKIKSKSFVLKKLSVYSKFRVALLYPDIRQETMNFLVCI